MEGEDKDVHTLPVDPDDTAKKSQFSNEPEGTYKENRLYIVLILILILIIIIIIIILSISISIK